MKRILWILGAVTLTAAGCGEQQQAPLYEKVAVSRRDVVVSASAAGAIEPILTVDVKSKASGEIIEMAVQTGDDVRPGQMLAVIDARVPRNNLAQADANLEVAQAQLANAKAALTRADTLYKTQSITETEFENANLGYANANAQVVRARTDLENARDRMTDTRVRAPLNGTIIAKNVELGTVISSPTQDVGGGTVLFKMANLDTVQVRTLVDETDIGKVRPGLPATITVDAYPNRPFQGVVLKIEPQATVQQNVTMFPVLIRIPNPQHLLKPGMNTEVEMHVGEALGVLAIPYTALRTQRDVGSAAHVLGLDSAEVKRQLAEARSLAADSASLAGQMGGGSSTQPADNGPVQSTTGAAAPRTMMWPDGQPRNLPAGVSEDQVRAIMRKRVAQQNVTAEEQDVMRRFFAANPGMAGGGGRSGRMRVDARSGPRGTDAGGSYIVFALKNGEPTPVQIRTGLTDLDHIEVVSGLGEQDTVLLLPSAGLIQSQRDMRERFQRMTGGGLPGVQQQPAGGQRPQAAPPPRP